MWCQIIIGSIYLALTVFTKKQKDRERERMREKKRGKFINSY